MSQMIARGDAKKIEATLIEINRQKAAKRDYIVPANRMAVIDGKLSLGLKTFKVGGEHFTEWKDAEAAADKSGLTLETLPGGGDGLSMSRHALTQLANDVHCPVKYLDFLRGSDQGKLADHNLTTLLSASGDKQLVRTLDGNVRAFLSNGYRVMDNADVFMAAADTLIEADAPIWQARLWDTGFEMLAVSRKITESVMRSETYQGGAHGWAGGKPGGMGDAGDGGAGVADMHRAMVKIENSEVGRGGLTVTMGIFRDACNNTAVVGKTLRAIHLGSRNASEGLVTYSEETMASESKTIWLKLRDAIKTAFDPKKFSEAIARAQKLTTVKIANAEKAVDNVIAAYEIAEERKAMILAALLGGRDLTGFGLVQAVTAQAHELDAANEPEAASELEKIGGAMMENPARVAELVA